MTAKQLRDYIDEVLTDVEFSYASIDGAICPTSRSEIALSWGEKDVVYKSLDEMMSDTFVFGASLNDIASKLIIY